VVLQVLSADREQVYAMLLTTPTRREEATDNPTVTFHQTAEGAVPPIRAWFYAGEKFGLEFAYPDDQARLIARHSNHPVLTTRLTYID
jgi:hypothetical protein